MHISEQTNAAREPTRRERGLLSTPLLVFVLLLLTLSAIGVSAWAVQRVILQPYEVRIYPNVYVLGIDLGGLTPEEAAERLAEAGIEPSVGSVGDSYDNAMAETMIGLYKTELIHHEGPWRGIDQVEYQTLEWVDWFNKVRLLEPIGNIPPIEFENLYYQQQEGEPAMVVGIP